MNTEFIRKDWVGSVVNERYRLVQWLGSFGQSGVYLCSIDANEEQKAAIKLFPATQEGAQECAAGWTTAASLSHPHLIRVLDTGRSQIADTAVLFVVCEYSREILSEILPDRPLSSGETREMMTPLLNTLAYLHEKGLVHSRLKPSNLMVIDDELKLSSDCIRGAAAAMTPPQLLEIYDAPEKERGSVSPATDMWSLGVTLVETLTQKPPAWDRSGQTQPLVPPSVPEPFAQIAKECLRLDPANRCTLNQVRARLDSEAAIPQRPIKAQGTGKPAIASRIGLLATVVLIGAIAIRIIHSHHAAPPAAAPDDRVSAPTETQPSAKPEADMPQKTPAQSSQTQGPSSPAPAPVPAPAQVTPPDETPTAEPAPMQAQAPEEAASGLSSKGAVAQRAMPEVPEKASLTIHGTVNVSIEVNVDANGSVGDASIASQGPSKYFANLALAAARNWKFTPPQTNGQGVPSVWLLHFAFRQSGTDATPRQESP